jgi:phosphinothricin acetyltransferase
MKIVSLEEKYRQPVTDLLNYYIVNGWAAFPENPVSAGVFDMLFKLAEGYPAVALLDADGSFTGFGILHAFRPVPVFRTTAELTYFLCPEHRRKGFGKQMLQYFEGEAHRMGITTFIASICDKNEASIQFHKRMGFTEQGHLPNVGIRRGQSFGIVYMQKDIEAVCAKK